MILKPQFKAEQYYLTQEGYGFGTTCWYTIVDHRGWRFFCCGPTPEDAEARGKEMEALIDSGADYETLHRKRDEWRPKP